MSVSVSGLSAHLHQHVSPACPATRVVNSSQSTHISTHLRSRSTCSQACPPSSLWWRVGRLRSDQLITPPRLPLHPSPLEPLQMFPTARPAADADLARMSASNRASSSRMPARPASAAPSMRPVGRRRSRPQTAGSVCKPATSSAIPHQFRQFDALSKTQTFPCLAPGSNARRQAKELHNVLDIMLENKASKAVAAVGVRDGNQRGGRRDSGGPATSTSPEPGSSAVSRGSDGTNAHTTGEGVQDGDRDEGAISSPSSSLDTHAALGTEGMLFDACFQETIRQISFHCKDWATVLLRVRSIYRDLLLDTCDAMSGLEEARINRSSEAEQRCDKLTRALTTCEC